MMLWYPYLVISGLRTVGTSSYKNDNSTDTITVMAKGGLQGWSPIDRGPGAWPAFRIHGVIDQPQRILVPAKSSSGFRNP